MQGTTKALVGAPDTARQRRVVGDVILATLTIVGVMAVTVLAGGKLTEAGALPLAVTLGGLLLLRRRWPVLVLGLSAAVIVAHRTADLTDVGWVWPATFAYASAALAGRFGWAVAIGVTQLAFAANWEWAVVAMAWPQTVATVGVEALWLAVVLAAATAYRNWRRWQDEVVVRLRQAAHERELEAAHRRAEERLRIARELHDVVAHTLAVVGVQLNVAADALDTAPAETRDALRLAQQVRGTAMADLAALVRVLRDAGVEEIPQPQAALSDVAGLVDRVRSSSLDATLTEVGDRRSVPAPVALALTRVVQEALTNVVRHAHASEAHVSLHYGHSRAEVTVVDNGIGGNADRRSGHGLAGMSERVNALGGELVAGGADGGFRVHATIPMAGIPK